MKSRIDHCAVAIALVLLSSGALGDVEEGRELYVQKVCYACHGYHGQGGPAPVVLSPSALSLEAFAAILRRPYDVMPAYSPSVLSDEEIESIFEYLESLPGPPALESLPAFSQ